MAGWDRFVSEAMLAGLAFLALVLTNSGEDSSPLAQQNEMGLAQ
jgi:hypothetical protein